MNSFLAIDKSAPWKPWIKNNREFGRSLLIYVTYFESPIQPKFSAYAWNCDLTYIMRKILELVDGKFQNKCVLNSRSLKKKFVE